MYVAAGDCNPLLFPYRFSNRAIKTGVQCMGRQRQLRAEDGFTFGVYESLPDGEPRGSCVVIQEIFGVNNHIRTVTDRLAHEGYASFAPQIFDRAERDVDLGYSEQDLAVGFKLAFQETDRTESLSDLQATVEEAGKHGRTGVVGFCYGGLLAWLCACQLSTLHAAVSYYGAGIANELKHSPKCPVMMHFGDLDSMIPSADVDRVIAAYPGVTAYRYSADHGFNCDQRESYDESAAHLALSRTLEHLRTHVG